MEKKGAQFEEAKVHKIRITLASKDVKSLEKGMSFGLYAHMSGFFYRYSVSPALRPYLWFSFSGEVHFIWSVRAYT